MASLNIPFLPSVNQHSPLAEISRSLDQMEKNGILEMPWPDYNYRPDVTFSIAHSNDCIFLKYYVREQAILATYTNTNDPVHQDSCVEFFIALGNDEAYYNLEFNCIGTCMLAYGTDRFNRNLLPEVHCNKIIRQAVITRSIDASGSTCFAWQLTLVIPAAVFIYHQPASLKGMQSRVNLFKCGDALPKPHFLTWKPVMTPFPDFHQPRFFADAFFM